MTDNEKAATFIGWREGQPCSHRERIDGSQWGNGIQQCFLCHCRLPIDRCFHTDPAPPMDDPRNYVKALAEIVRRHKCGPIELLVNWDREAQKPMCALRFKAILRSDVLIDFDEPAKALAVLYDAEHATQAGAEP